MDKPTDWVYRPTYLKHKQTQQSIKFDDLCSNFQQHEALDSSGAYVEMTVNEDGTVAGMSYVAGSGAGLVPLTVPTASAASVSF